MVRLNDNQLESVNQLRQKSRAYLSVGALAVAAGVAFLAIPNNEHWLRIGVVTGAALALLIFAVSAVVAVSAERATRRVPDAPNLVALAALGAGNGQEWSEEQLTLWVALEFIDAVVPSADAAVDQIARLVDRQLRFFLLEVGVLGATLIVALLA